MMDPRRFTTFVLVFGAVALVGVAIEWLRMRVNGWLALIVVSLVLLVLALTAQRVLAHDHKHPANNEWLKELKSVDGTLCCDGSDYVVAQWRVLGAYSDGSPKYQVAIDGDWQTVPPGAVVTMPNRDGVAKLWPTNKGMLGLQRVRCFQPGALG